MPKWNVMNASLFYYNHNVFVCCVYVTGLFMALQPRIIACGNSTAAFAMAVRFLTGPAVMAAASIVVGLRGTLLHVAIVQVPLFLFPLPPIPINIFPTLIIVFIILQIYVNIYVHVHVHVHFPSQDTISFF